MFVLITATLKAIIHTWRMFQQSPLSPSQREEKHTK
ncbi:hypothetical protein GBAR_LOCUS16934 [Geodia barretti]|uniref:Uncharacterized protein n=1 Tax=Geodia barretti TaxID=519541 RepID=A0AA35SH19_GEOBA|nr:hypothetical protein GBAR_LOCUS16934 [Geodia barretti]